jgi:endonuclease/exonuclease/phosphatase (EEP) superfamily protein YafD
MIATTRASITSGITVLLACVACAGALPLAVAGAAEGSISYTHESLQEYEKQLAANRIGEVTVNKRLRSLRVRLKSGSHVLAQYAPHQEPNVVAALKAKRVPVVVLKPAEAIREVPKKAAHHKIRYIAGGILIAVVIVVGAVLLIDRRRKSLRD